MRCGRSSIGIISGIVIVRCKYFLVLSFSQEVPVWVANCGRSPCLLLLKLGLYSASYNIQLHIVQFVSVLVGCSSGTHLDQDCSVHDVDIG
mmetsp:Transcript_17807/g.17999  ORF Transcript_17807/g.17999 Transcript_17807/m.17999 type:complete len:91 (+) Transcript_17807:121-393(+)